MLEGIQEAESKGALKQLQKDYPDDYKWLQQDIRRKKLAFDPDTKEFKVDEAKATLVAEQQGIIESPVSRGIHADGSTRGDDYFDGNGISWDVKDARMKDVDDLVRKVIGGENTLIDGKNVSVSEFKALENAIKTKLPPDAKGKVRFVK